MSAVEVLMYAPLILSTVTTLTVGSFVKVALDRRAHRAESARFRTDAAQWAATASDIRTAREIVADIRAAAPRPPVDLRARVHEQTAARVRVSAVRDPDTREVLGWVAQYGDRTSIHNDWTSAQHAATAPRAPGPPNLTGVTVRQLMAAGPETAAQMYRYVGLDPTPALRPPEPDPYPGLNATDRAWLQRHLDLANPEQLPPG